MANSVEGRQDPGKPETDLSIFRTVVVGAQQTAATVHGKFAKRMLCDAKM